jgi:CRP-like cAMP-binding protein
MNEPVIDLGLLERVGARSERFEAGDKIFLQGDRGDCMYVVKSGRVNIQAAGMVLENIGANGVFGEMSLIDDSPRSAMAIAAEVSEVMRVDGNAFQDLVRQDPEFALRLMRLMADRIRRTNESL